MSQMGERTLLDVSKVPGAALAPRRGGAQKSPLSNQEPPLWAVAFTEP
jgi:hypothetical protein